MTITNSDDNGSEIKTSPIMRTDELSDNMEEQRRRNDGASSGNKWVSGERLQGR